MYLGPALPPAGIEIVPVLLLVSVSTVPELASSMRSSALAPPRMIVPSLITSEVTRRMTPSGINTVPPDTTLSDAIVPFWFTLLGWMPAPPTQTWFEAPGSRLPGPQFVSPGPPLPYHLSFPVSPCQMNASPVQWFACATSDRTAVTTVTSAIRTASRIGRRTCRPWTNVRVPRTVSTLELLLAGRN